MATQSDRVKVYKVKCEEGVHNPNNFSGSRSELVADDKTLGLEWDQKLSVVFATALLQGKPDETKDVVVIPLANIRSMRLHARVRARPLGAPDPTEQAELDKKSQSAA